MAQRFGIALKPQDRPVELSPDYQRKLRNEFHARYLESIGATPTPANLAMVRKHMPIDNCKFTTAWKSRGWVADYVYIQPDDGAAAGSGGGRASPSANAVDELLTLVPEAAGPSAAPQGDGEEEDRKEPQLGAPIGSMSFESAQRAFLYPYKQQGRGPRGAMASSAPSPRRQRTDASSEYDPADRGGFESRDLHRYEQYTEEEVQVELKSILNLHTKEIVALQVEFLRHFPLDAVKTRLSEEELRLCRAELQSKRTTRFIGLLTLLLYWSHLAERAGRQVEEEQLSALYCAVQHYFASVRERMKKRRGLLLFVLPILLLEVRVTVEALFRQAFPKWWTTVDARTTLRDMDDHIERIFDPNAYLSQISRLESSTKAVRISGREQQGVTSKHRYARYYATSALVRSALPKAHMVAQHRHMAGGSLPEVSAALPLEARQQLFITALGKAPVRSRAA